MWPRTSVLFLLLALGCRSERRDVALLCAAFEQAFRQQEGDEKFKQALEQAPVRTELARKLRIDLGSTDLRVRMSAIDRAADLAKQHRLEKECKSLGQVAEIARAIRHAIEKDPPVGESKKGKGDSGTK